MRHLIFFAMSGFLLAGSGIYSYVIDAANGGQIDFGDFRHKKILVVNIATGSPRAGQLAGLQQLQQQFAGSLVIIGCPSGSFGNESRSNDEIIQFCRSQYNVRFLLAAKGAVKGPGIQPLYSWITRQAENGILDSEVKGDFQKYLIDEHGELAGIFAGSLSPLDQQLVAAIAN